MIGKKTPNVTLKTRVRDDSIGGDNPYRWEMVKTNDLFAGKACDPVFAAGRIYAHLLDLSASRF